MFKSAFGVLGTRHGHGKTLPAVVEDSNKFPYFRCRLSNTVNTMISFQKIHYYRSLFKDIPLKDLFTILRKAHIRKLAAGEIYLKEGSLDKSLAYIQKGLIRVYQISDKGEDLTIMLRWEEHFFASHDTIIYNRPSRFYYQALEDTVIIEADYGEVEATLYHSPGFEKTRYHFLLHMLSEALERIETFVLLNPEERYLEIMKRHPHILQRVPDKHLATCLGITPVSLSRIRKRIANKSS